MAIVMVQVIGKLVVMGTRSISRSVACSRRKVDALSAAPVLGDQGISSVVITAELRIF